MKIPSYHEDEVKFFHPVFEYSFKPIIINNKFFLKNYELKHHRKIKNGTIPDFIFQNKKNKKSVLICEIKRNKSAVFNYNFNQQVKGYAETLKDEMEKPFYILTNLEIINFYKYSKERNKVFHQLIKPSPIKVADFDEFEFKKFSKKLELELRKIVDITFDNKLPEWKFGLSDLERLLDKNYNDEGIWREIISESLSGYVIGSKFKDKKNNIINLLNDNGFQFVVQKLNSKKKYNIFDSSFEAGKSFRDGSDLGFIIQSLVHENYSTENQGTITSTDDEISNLVSFFSNYSLDKKLLKNQIILDPTAGIGNLLVNLNNFHKDLNREQIWANEIDFHFIDCLKLKLNLIYNSNNKNQQSTVTNKDISLLKSSDFKNVKIVLSNPPFKRGANKANSKEKDFLAKAIKANTNQKVVNNIGQLGVECLHLELIVKYSNNLTNFVIIFPSRYLASISRESILFRNFLIKEFGIEYIVNYPHKNIFSNVAKNTCLLIGKKNSKLNTVDFINILTEPERINYLTLKKILNKNESNNEILIRKIPKKNLLEKNESGWKEFFNSKSFNNLIEPKRNNFVKLDDYVDFLSRGNAGNVGFSDLIFPNKNNKIGKKLFKLNKKFFILGIRNSEKIPININKRSFNYLSLNPESSLISLENKEFSEIFHETFSEYNKKLSLGVQYKKKTKDINRVIKVLKSLRIYEKNTILIPRAIRRHGNIGILSERAVVSTNFVLIKAKDNEHSDLIVSWFTSIFGQLQLEELSNNERGVRKTEINYLKQKFLIPKLSNIKPAYKIKLRKILANDLKPIDLNNYEFSENDELWLDIIYSIDKENYKTELIRLLEDYIDIREP